VQRLTMKSCCIRLAAINHAVLAIGFAEHSGRRSTLLPDAPEAPSLVGA